MNGFANAIFSVLLGWLRNTLNAAWQVLNGDAGGGLVDFFSRYWLTIVLVLCVAGTVIDRLVWFFRWRPDYVWATKWKRWKQRLHGGAGADGKDAAPEAGAVNARNGAGFVPGNAGEPPVDGGYAGGMNGGYAVGAYDTKVFDVGAYQDEVGYPQEDDARYADVGTQYAGAGGAYAGEDAADAGYGWGDGSAASVPESAMPLPSFEATRNAPPVRAGMPDDALSQQGFTRRVAPTRTASPYARPESAADMADMTGMADVADAFGETGMADAMPPVVPMVGFEADSRASRADAEVLPEPVGTFFTQPANGYQASDGSLIGAFLPDGVDAGEEAPDLMDGDWETGDRAAAMEAGDERAAGRFKRTKAIRGLIRKASSLIAADDEEHQATLSDLQTIMNRDDQYYAPVYPRKRPPT